MAFPELDAARSKEDLAARRSELEQEMTRMVADAGVKPFSDEEGEEFARLKAEFDEAEKRLKEIEERDRIVGEFSQRPQNRETPVSFNAPRPGAVRTEDIYDLGSLRHESPDKQLRELEDRAKRSIETSTFEDPKGPDNVARLLERDTDGELARRILVTGSPTYKRAFGKYLGQVHLSPEETRALTTAANYAVPYTVDPTVVLTSNGVLNPIRQIARVITITGNKWTGVSTAGTTASYAAESTEVTDTSPTLAQPTADVEKAQAFTQYPLEVGQDWGALQSEMARLFADAKDTLESDKFLTGLGHGSNQPEGLLVGATGTVFTATASSVVVADLYTLEAALAPRWRAQARFAGNRAVYQAIRQFDTAGGANLWVQLQFGDPANLIGFPAHEWSNISSAITTGAASVLIFGDFNEFTIVDRVGMNVEVVPHMLGSNRLPNGNRGLYAYWRNTSDVRTAAAFKTLKVTS